MYTILADSEYSRECTETSGDTGTIVECNCGMPDNQSGSGELLPLHFQALIATVHFVGMTT